MTKALSLGNIVLEPAPQDPQLARDLVDLYIMLDAQAERIEYLESQLEDLLKAIPN